MAGGPPARAGQPELPRLWELVAIEIGIVIAGEVLARASTLVESLLGDLFSNYTSVRLMEHAAMLDPHTAAELDLDQIWHLVDDLIAAHGDWIPALH